MRFSVLLITLCLAQTFTDYDAARVKQNVAAALVTVEQVLNTTRHPTFAADVPHLYEDKYLLAEFLTNAAIAAQLNAFDALGLKASLVKQLQQWAANSQTVGLAFRSTKMCTYDHQETKDVEDPTTRVTTVNNRPVITQKTFTKVTTHFWNMDISWEFFAFRGSLASSAGSTDSSESSPRKPIASRTFNAVITSSTTLKPSVCDSDPTQSQTVDVTWLFAHVAAPKNRPNFQIDRMVKTCYTPRRNEPVTAALNSFNVLNDWCYQVSQAISTLVASSQLPFGTFSDSEVFVPILPLFEEPSDCDTKANTQMPEKGKQGKKAVSAAVSSCTPQVVLSPSDLNALLTEQEDSLAAKMDEISRSFPQLAAESKALLILSHIPHLSGAYSDGVNSIESMLRKQLVDAIGKEVSPTDFGQFIRYNNRKIFNPEFRPRDFSYAIRRPDHDPEGIVAIQQTDGSDLPFPISALERIDTSNRPLNITLSGGTVISLKGQRYLHTTIFYQFAAQSLPSISVSARARQFSSFVLMMGTLIAPDEFKPTLGLIIKDKDDVLIPLLLENIPTPKAFRDAIESLSPNQQAFAKAFRSMQLASTLFALVVIEIKPQLEVLLKLPADALTKEIQLTQDLMELFIEYQIPSDLLSYKAEGKQDNTTQKVEYVKAQVTQMKNMLEQEKQEEIKAKQQEDAMRQNVYASSGSSYDPYRGGSSRGSSYDYEYYDPQTGGMQAARAHLDDSMAFGGPSAEMRVVNRGMEIAPMPPPESESAGDAKPSEPRPPVEVEQQVVTEQPRQRPGIEATQLPQLLDERVLSLDPDSSLRAAIIKPGPVFTRTSQKGLLGTPTTDSSNDLNTEQKKAFDLLEALSKSGVLPFRSSALHVLIGSTQSFDETLLDTIIQQNRNPIDNMERSSLIIASTVFNRPVKDLVAPDQVPRLHDIARPLFDLDEKL